jgi:uncharacterized membrane protein (DUF4010 family)
LVSLFAFSALTASGLAFSLMLLATALIALLDRGGEQFESTAAVDFGLESPFSLTAALNYGFIFLVLQIGAVLAQRQFGEWGMYATSFFGGLVSSVSAVAAAATLAANGSISPQVAGASAVIASLMSVLSNWPLVMRARNPELTRKLGLVLGIVMLVGIAGAIGQKYAPRL